MISTDTERREMHATGRRRQGSRIDVCEGSRHCVESEFGGSDDDMLRRGGGGGTLLRDNIMIVCGVSHHKTGETTIR